MAAARWAAEPASNVDGPNPDDPLAPLHYAVCEPESPHMFALGNHTVSCTAHDSAIPQNATKVSFIVSIIDSTGPVIADHEAVIAEATKPGGADVAYASPSTSDVVDGAGTAECTPVSGRCDRCRWRRRGKQRCACELSARPHHDHLVRQGCGVVSYASPATSDVVDGAGTASCSPLSDSTFALGVTTVSCSKSDLAGNAADPVAFTVSVHDSTAPRLA